MLILTRVRIRRRHEHGTLRRVRIVQPQQRLVAPRVLAAHPLYALVEEGQPLIVVAHKRALFYEAREHLCAHY